MATVQISGLPELLAAVGDDWLEIEEAATGLSYRIKKANLLGAILTGGGTIVTGGHTITVPASGTAALKDGTPAAGNLAMWADADTVEDAGVALTDVPLLDAIQTWTAQQTFNANVTVNGVITAQSLRTATMNLNDDTAASIQTDGSGFVFVCPTRNTEYMGAAVFRAMDTLEGVEISRIFGSTANFDVATGVLTGTTGVDGRVTVSAAGDGKIYLENRRGFQRTFRIVILG